MRNIPSPEDSIRTERLILRRARPGDLEAMHAVLSHPEAMLYWSTPPHSEIGQTEEWLASMLDDDPALRDDYVVEFGGRAVGKAGCWRLPQIGYILHPDLWGQGLAREALSAVIPALFARHPIARITADVDPRNRRSLRLLDRLGFTVCGRAERTWLVGDQWCDSVYLALDRGALR